MAGFADGLANVLKNSELEQLKAYVSAPGKLGANQADSTVLLHVTHSNLKAEFMEIRFDKHVRYYSLAPGLMECSCVRREGVERTTDACSLNSADHRS